MIPLPIYSEEPANKAVERTISECLLKLELPLKPVYYAEDRMPLCGPVLSLGTPGDALAESSLAIIPGPSPKQILHTPAGLENTLRAIRLWDRKRSGNIAEPIFPYDLIDPNPEYTGSLSGYQGKIKEYLAYASKQWNHLTVDIEVSGNIKVDEPEDECSQLISVGVRFVKANGNESETAVWTADALQDPYCLSRLSLLMSCDVPISAFNGTFDFKWINIQLAPYLNNVRVYPSIDPMLKHYSLFPGAAGDHGLKDLAQKLLGAPEWEHDIKRYTGGGGHYERIPQNLLYSYNASDVYWTDAVDRQLDEWLDLPKNAPARHVYENVIMPSVPLIVDLEAEGWPIDVPEAERLRDEHSEVLVKELAKFREAVGDPTEYLSETAQRQKLTWPEKGIPLRDVHFFNPSSVPQVKQWLINHDVELPINKKTKKPSTDENALTTILESTPPKKVVKFITRLQQYRHTRKMYGTYLVGPLKRQRENHVRSRYQYTTVTGRLKSEQHTVPRPGKDGTAPYRRIYTSGSLDKSLIGPDYGQIEARIVAELCGDRQMIDDFQLGRPDFFSLLLPGAYPKRYRNYDAVLNMKEDNPRQYKDDRQSIKPIAHGANYMRQPKAMAAQLKLDLAEANRMYYSYMERYPALKDWQEETMAYVRGDLVDPQWGVPGLFTAFGYRFQQGVITDNTAWSIKNQAIAFKPQSTGSSITLSAAVALRPKLKKYEGGRIVGLIHDAIYAIVPNDKAVEALALMEKVMQEKAAEIFTRVPFTTDGHIGRNWEEISV